MKANPLFVAAIVLVVLGAAVYYTSENPPSVEDNDSPLLLDVKHQDIQEIEIRRPTGDPMAFVRGKDDHWDFKGDVGYPADDAAVGLMATNLDGLRADRLVDPQTSDWRPYGLEDEGNLAVSMTPKGGETSTIIFGNETPTGSGVFARLVGDPRLFTVYSYVKTSFDKPLFDWRDKRLLQVESDSVSEVQLRAGLNRFVFQSASSGEWSILEPVAVRADDFAVGELVRAIQGAEMTEVLAADEAARLSRAFSRPYVQARVDDGESHSLTVARSGDGYFAKTSDMDGVFGVSPALVESLDRELNDLREKKLFDFGFDPVHSIEVQDGDRSVRITKSDSDWMLASENDRALDPEKVQTLIDALRNLAAVEFVSDAEWAQRANGLANPAIKAIVASGAESEQRRETVILSSPSLPSVFAARVGEPSTYRVEQAASQELKRALGSLVEPSESTAP